MLVFRDIVLNILPGFKLSGAESENSPTISEADRLLAWKIYVDLTTRISIEPLLDHEGDEKAALDSLYCLFQNIRAAIAAAGPDAANSGRIGIFVLNKVLRPFLARWHQVFATGVVDEERKAAFRKQLKELQKSLRGYVKSLLEIMDLPPELDGKMTS